LRPPRRRLLAGPRARRRHPRRRLRRPLRGLRLLSWLGHRHRRGPSDKKSDAVIWLYDGGLYALDGESGATILRPDGIRPCEGLRFMQAAIAVNGRIIFGADGHLCS
jgi:hypothetical protein